MKVDYFMPREKIGTSRAPIVTGNRVSAAAVILPGATGVIQIPGSPR